MKRTSRIVRTTEENTPASLGFRMPAEWEPHEATWIGWPHNATDWPGKLEPIHWVYGEIVRKIVSGEIVRILVNSTAHEAQARKVLKSVGVSTAMVQFLRFPTNRGWTRDFGPIFVKRSKPRPEVAIARFRFNAWARYPDWKKDDAIPEQAARRLKIKIFRIQLGGRDVVLEGGSIDVNGSGSVLTTEECFLDKKRQVRNPGFDRAQTETALRESLGVTNVIWLGKGITGDDTHGHVDDLCRFVNRRTVVLCREKNSREKNYKPLEENWERLRSARLENGSRPDVIALPMPSPLFFDGVRLPASYANFYVSNSSVLVPTFNDPNDRIALGILGDLFSTRSVVGVHSVDLVWGFGTIHCLTQQQPARP
ncbi:MAG TPA: agmatine deiminase family protein [Candidatus Acidoferrales bacterium]|nr:agmatine deiminase family protein [Candidatus Acidoferrales bacterium]